MGDDVDQRTKPRAAPAAETIRSLRVFVSRSHNPWFNLATEEWLYRELEPSRQTLFLWRNHDTVVIGRNQNPWSECNLAKMEQDDVKLARRTTGGGAVFHDLGNTCFTFLSPRDGYDRTRNLDIVRAAVRRFGVEARASGRNDLTVESHDGPRKISGSAFREARDRSFHHGTLLLDADLARLADYLTPNPKKLESKGKASVRSRVANIGELKNGVTAEAMNDALIAEFSLSYALPVEVEELDPSRLAGIGALQEKFAEFSSWDWRFGRAPQFTHRMSEYLSWGFVEVHADSDGGVITRAQVFSDGIDPDMIDSLTRALTGKIYGQSGVALAVRETAALHPERASDLAEFAAWLNRQVEV